MEQTLFTAEQIIDAFEHSALGSERQAEWLVWLMGEVD